MRNIFVGMGSNVGDRLGYLESAQKHINELPSTKIVASSSVYETEPVGKKDQAQFFNMVVELETDLNSLQLLDSLKSVEKLVGRKPSERWGPREIDLDILYYNNRVEMHPLFQVPHAEAASRRFVLVPLNEIAPEFKDPVRALKVSELLDRCTDRSAVRKTVTRLQEH